MDGPLTPALRISGLGGIYVSRNRFSLFAILCVSVRKDSAI